MIPRASIVVPTYKRPGQLKRCLSSVMNQNFDPAAYEVVVADDAASEELPWLLESWAGLIWDKARAPALVYRPVRGPHGSAIVRNAGWREAKGKIIAFTDDDCVPSFDWLALGVKTLEENPHAVAAWGRLVMPLPERPTAPATSGAGERPTAPATSGAGERPTEHERIAAGLATAEFVTANCFCRRQALEAVGGFDERFRASWREDSDLLFTLLERYGDVLHAPEAVVVHPVRPARWGASLSRQKREMYDALLYKKHPDLYKKKIRRTPWLYYAVLGALGAAAVGVLKKDKRLVVAGAGLWALLTGTFAADRLRETTRRPAHVAEMIVTSALIPPSAVFWRLWGAFRYRVLFY